MFSKDKRLFDTESAEEDNQIEQKTNVTPWNIIVLLCMAMAIGFVIASIVVMIISAHYMIAIKSENQIYLFDEEFSSDNTLSYMSSNISTSIALKSTTKPSLQSADDTVSPSHFPSSTSTNPPIDSLQICLSDECVTSEALISASMNFSIDPCNDFYSFVCGNWKKYNPVPIDLLRLDNYGKLNQINLNNIKNDLQNSFIDKKQPRALKKLQKFYHACLNNGSRNLAGYSMLVSKINEFGGWPLFDKNWDESKFDWEDSLIKYIKSGHSPIFAINIIDDLKHTNMKRLSINPINYYQELYKIIDSYEMRKIGQTFNKSFEFDSEYYENIEELKTLIKLLLKPKDSDLDEDEDDMSVIEPQFNNDPGPKLQPQINLTKILKSILNIQSFNYETDVLVNDYFIRISDVLNLSVNKRTIANLFAMSFLIEFGIYTTIEMQHLLQTIDIGNDRNSSCFDLTQKNLPNLLDRLFIGKHFDKKWKTEMTEIIDLIHQTYITSLETSDWMDSNSIENTVNKINAIKKYIAYPKWMENDTELDQYYDRVIVKEEDFFSSAISIIKEKKMNKLRLFMDNPKQASVSQYEWEGEVMTANAFYRPQTNGIYITGGLAQFPFFVSNRMMTLNLGALGSSIGHELTHALDNSRHKYDSDGNYNNRLSYNSEDIFEQKSQCFVDQYNRFEYLMDDLYSNSGRQTLDENIADNGGVHIAFQALKLYIRQRKDTFKRLPGKLKNFSEEQLFFISFANKFCSNDPDFAVSMLFDEHAPNFVRVNATLANFDVFSKAFDCKKGSKMNPIDKCVIW